MAQSGRNHRAILHVDMDAFYASVEQRDQPSLRGQAVIVGGVGRRGVVAAASYEARRHGVRSAMPTAQARELCPDGIYLRPRMARYQEFSATIFRLLEEYTPMIEPLSLDEAFLDVSASLTLFGSARAIAKDIKRRILSDIGLIASIGVAPNKFLAKLACSVSKPDGLYELRQSRVQQFLDPLPVAMVWGIGAKAQAKLVALGLHTVGQLRRAPAQTLTAALGQRVEHFQALARGEDQRDVERSRRDQSISHESTFEHNLTELIACRKALLDLSGQVAARLRRKGLRAGTIGIKVRTHQFRTSSRQRTLSQAVDQDRAVFAVALDLLMAWRDTHGALPVRLLGVVASRLEAVADDDLFNKGQTDSRLDRTSDQIKARFGSTAISPARLVKSHNKE